MRNPRKTPPPRLEFVSPRERRQVAPRCPCGKDNADGKFVPFRGCDGSKGYCHSCQETFFPAPAPPVDLPPRPAPRRVAFRRGPSGASPGRRPAPGVQQAPTPPAPEDSFWAAPPPANTALPPAFPPEELAISLRRGRSAGHPFYRFLCKYVPPERVQAVFRSLHVGSLGNGASCFWLVNRAGRALNAKVVRYGLNGKRVRSHPPYHLGKRTAGYGLCLFGEHQLAGLPPGQPVLLFESEKTAVLTKLRYPRLACLATGGAAGLTREKAEALRGRRVFILFDADASGRKNAQQALALLQNLGNVRPTVHELFPHRSDGYDLADYLLEDPEAHLRPAFTTALEQWLLGENPTE